MKLLTLKQAARQLGVSVETLVYLCDRYSLTPIFDASGELRYREEDLKKLLAASETMAATDTSAKKTISQIGSENNSFESFIVSMGVSFEAFKTFAQFAYLKPKRKTLLLGLIAALLFVGGVYARHQAVKNDTSKVALEPQNSEATPEVLGTQTSKLKLTGSVIFGLPVVSRENLNIQKNLLVEGTSLFKGDITAPNVVYSITAGQNVTISGDPQTPTISVAQVS